MSFLKPYPLDANDNAFLSNVSNVVNSQNVRGGNGIRVRKTSDGIHIEARDIARKDNLCYRGNYDYAQEYFPNDLVYVDSTLSYSFQNGTPIPFANGFTSGIYVCTSYIPAVENDSSSFLTYVVPAYTAAGGTATNVEANSYRWKYNTYFPTNPKVPASAQTTISDSGFSINASCSFWDYLPSGGGNSMWKIFDESSSYAVGDQVLVDCNKGYSVSFDSTSGSLPPLAAGLFQCIVAVPALTSGSRPTGNVYYPIAPTIPTGSVVTVSGSIYNRTFWQPLAPMIKMNICVNGSTMTAFINGVVSGSTFDLSQLPYH